MLARTSINGLIIDLNFLGAYSARKIAHSMHDGAARTIAMHVTQIVPAMNGYRPYEPSLGSHEFEKIVRIRGELNIVEA